MALILRDGLVITMDGQRRVLDRGNVVVEGANIVDVTHQSYRGGPADTVFDCQGRIVLPGLINVHAHTTEALFRGCATDLPFLQWLLERNHPLLERMQDDDAFAAGLLCGIEMLASGTTCYLDPEVWPEHFEAVGRAVQEVGLRACLALALEGATGYAVDDGPQLKAAHGATDSLARVRSWHGAADGRIQVWLGPRVMSAIDWALAEFLRQAVADSICGITTHFAEIPEDVAQIRQEHGLGPAAFLGEIGLLGPHMVLTHALCIDREDLAILARTGTCIAHCPASNMKLGNGVAPIAALLEAGILVGLGTDGGLCNDSYDLLREMNLAGLIHKANQHDPRAVPAEKILEMVTCDAARILGLEDRIGSLEPGKRADITVLDGRAAGWRPIHNPIANLVYGSATRDSVDTVIVDGRPLLRSGRPCFLDAESIMSEAQLRSETLVAAAGLSAAVRSPWQQSRLEE